MKILKKIVIAFLFFVLANLIGILVISYNLKDTLIDGVLKIIVAESIKNPEEKFFTEPIDIPLDIDNSQLQELLNSEEVKGLLEKYMDITIDGMTNEEKTDEITIEKDILDYLKNHKEELSSIVGQDVTDEMINQAANDFESKEKSKIFKEAIKNAENSLTSTEKAVIKGYKFFISKTFKYIVIALIILDLFLLAIIQMSFYKWIINLGSAMATSGVLLIIISFITRLIVKNVSGLEGFHITNLQTTGIMILIIGLFIVIIYKIIMNLIAKKKEEKEKYAVS